MWVNPVNFRLKVERTGRQVLAVRTRVGQRRQRVHHDPRPGPAAVRRQRERGLHPGRQKQQLPRREPDARGQA